MQELETLLDDDQDMAEMYLSRRAAAEERAQRVMEERRQSDAELGMHGAHSIAFVAWPQSKVLLSSIVALLRSICDQSTLSGSESS